MKFQDIENEVRSNVARFGWDRIIEKHEGPENWAYLVKDNFVEFLRVDGFDVLLPIDKSRHANVRIDRCVVSRDAKTLTLFLQDTTYDTGIFAGYLAVCERVPEQDWYIAIVYHECWINQLEAIY